MPTRISWTQETWNPTVGCHKVSEGCRHCYAERIALKNGWTPKTWTQANAAENVILKPERLMQPKRVKAPTMYFVNSMSDVFHENIPDDYILKIWQVMESCPRHIFQVLTKRPERMAAWCNQYRPTPAPNVWLGTSVENQRAAIQRIPHLLNTPAGKRFLSCEPLLEAVTLHVWIEKLDWVIVGGESGPDFRPIDKSWARSILAQCRAAGVPFFGKQDSAYYSEVSLLFDGKEIKEFPPTPELDDDPAPTGEQLSLF